MSQSFWGGLGLGCGGVGRSNSPPWSIADDFTRVTATIYTVWFSNQGLAGESPRIQFRKISNLLFALFRGIDVIFFRRTCFDLYYYYLMYMYVHNDVCCSLTSFSTLCAPMIIANPACDQLNSNGIKMKTSSSSIDLVYHLIIHV